MVKMARIQIQQSKKSKRFADSVTAEATFHVVFHLFVLLQIVGPSVLFATVRALVKVGLLWRLLDLLRFVWTL